MSDDSSLMGNIILGMVFGFVVGYNVDKNVKKHFENDYKMNFLDYINSIRFKNQKKEHTTKTTQTTKTELDPVEEEKQEDILSDETKYILEDDSESEVKNVFDIGFDPMRCKTPQSACSSRISTPVHLEDETETSLSKSELVDKVKEAIVLRNHDEIISYSHLLDKVIDLNRYMIFCKTSNGNITVTESTSRFLNFTKNFYSLEFTSEKVLVPTM